MLKTELSEVEEQEKIMKQMIRKEMIRKIEAKIRARDSRTLNRLQNMLTEDDREQSI